MARRSRQRGYALLLTLTLILLLGVALTGMARRSLTGALEAQVATEELQRRWAVRSCQATLLERAEELLREAEPEGRNGSAGVSGRNRPTSVLRMSCRLAGAPYELILTDEQAKLNVNHVLKEGGTADAEIVLERLIASFPDGLGRPAAVRLRPLATSGGRTEDILLQPVASFGQVFDGSTVKELAGEKGVAGLASVVTCWGDGKVNFRRATDDVIEAACGKAIGPTAASALLDARRQHPGLSMAATLAAADRIDAETRQALARRLTDVSTCHGLWVIARRPLRSWYTLAVEDASRSPRGGPTGIRRVQFEW